MFTLSRKIQRQPYLQHVINRCHSEPAVRTIAVVLITLAVVSGHKHNGVNIAFQKPFFSKSLQIFTHHLLNLFNCISMRHNRLSSGRSFCSLWAMAMGLKTALQSIERKHGLHIVCLVALPLKGHAWSTEGCWPLSRTLKLQIRCTQK